MAKDKVVLAYSGGLDTSVILKWLQVEKNYDVISVCVDVGQIEDFDAVHQKALDTGAVESLIVDVKEEFVKDYVFKGIKADAVYEEDYLLGTAFARPLISKVLVDIAHEKGAVAIAHGATGKGNDQVRFEITIKALDPYIKIIAPWREWDLKSREDCIEYASKYGIPTDVNKKNIYSLDENLWHLSHEGGDLEDPWNQYNEDMFKLTNKLADTPDEPEYLEIGFKNGEPVSINGEDLAPLELLKKVNELGGKHGVGIVDIVENRLVGMKSRGVYETPGGAILYEAHKHLEKLVLDHDMISFKTVIAQKYGELIYNGLWEAPLKTCMDAFVDKMSEVINGEVCVRLYKGGIKVVGTKSPDSLYNEEFVTFGSDEVYTQKDAEGFINLFSLSLKINSINKLKREEEGK